MTIRSWLGNPIHCPECWDQDPERVDVDPGGMFVIAECQRCHLQWRVSG